MDSGGRATQEAKAESRSLRGVNEDSRTELMSMDGLNTGFAGAKTCKPLSREKCIFRGALKLRYDNPQGLAQFPRQYSLQRGRAAQSALLKALQLAQVSAQAPRRYYLR